MENLKQNHQMQFYMLENRSIAAGIKLVMKTAQRKQFICAKIRDRHNLKCRDNGHDRHLALQFSFGVIKCNRFAQ